MAGPKITPQKSRGTPGTNKGFWHAEVMKVTATAEDPYLVFIKIDRLGVGINDPVPADYVGSPPRVGDVLWCTFIENNQDTYLIFNTQHQAGDDMTDGVVRFGGQTEATGVTIKIDPTEYVGSNRASIMFGDATEMGTGGTTSTLGDWYIYDETATQYNLYHTGHSNTTNGGFTITATGTHATSPVGTFTRNLWIQPTADVGGYELMRFISDCDNARPMYFNRHIRTGGSLYPEIDGTRYLGYSGNRWNTVYATNGTINTSDQNEKTDIADSDLGLNFINALRPVSFKWIDRGGGVAGVRTHYGLLGQEVESVLGAAASTTAIWTKSAIPASDAIEETYNDNGTIEMEGRGAVEAHDLQGLRYEELISPIIKAIQEINVQLEGNAFQSQSAVDYIASFDAAMLAKQPQADQNLADIADLKTRVAALEAG